MNSLIPPAMGWIVPLLFFHRDGFIIESPMKVDMPLIKVTEPNQTYYINEIIKFRNIMRI